MTRPAAPVSVFTASHNPRFLDDAYRSLSEQSFGDWQWLVLLNGKAMKWEPADPDGRVELIRTARYLRGVGAAKRAACEAATGDILVELEDDDMLARGCLAQVVDAFRDPKVVLAYSDWAQINEDGSPNEDQFDASNGWQYSHGSLDGRNLLRCRAMAPYPHNLGYIWYSPNHVRSFRRSAYEQVGGYNRDLEYLADQDLMLRLYQVGEFHQIERCLYIQRVHPNMAQVNKRINEAIEEQTVVNYRQHIEELALCWAKRNGLRCLQLRTPIWIGDDPDDRYDQQTVDPADPLLTAADSSVGVIKAFDVLQRLPDRAAFLNEVYRVLAHAGLILTQTPSTDGRGAFQDPSAVAWWNENSFMYLTQSILHDLVPDLNARLQVSYLSTHYQSPAHEQLGVAYVQANLLAVKDGPRQGGPLLC